MFGSCFVKPQEPLPVVEDPCDEFIQIYLEVINGTDFEIDPVGNLLGCNPGPLQDVTYMVFPKIPPQESYIDTAWHKGAQNLEIFLNCSSGLPGDEDFEPTIVKVGISKDREKFTAVVTYDGTKCQIEFL